MICLATRLRKFILLPCRLQSKNSFLRRSATNVSPGLESKLPGSLLIGMLSASTLDLTAMRDLL